MQFGGCGEGGHRRITGASVHFGVKASYRPVPSACESAVGLRQQVEPRGAHIRTDIADVGLDVANDALPVAQGQQRSSIAQIDEMDHSAQRIVRIATASARLLRQLGQGSEADELDRRRTELWCAWDRTQPVNVFRAQLKLVSAVKQDFG